MGKIGEGPSRNMYKGPMDKAKAGRSQGGRQRWVGRGCMMGEQWRQLHLDNNNKNII